jgi:hypothetical protein
MEFAFRFGVARRPYFHPSEIEGGDKFHASEIERGGVLHWTTKGTCGAAAARHTANCDNMSFTLS